MGTPDKSYKIPELSQLGRDAEAWALQALAGVELQAYTNAKWAQSRMADLHVAPNIQQQPPKRRSEPYRGGSQAVRAQVAAYVPDTLSPEDKRRSIDETAKLLKQVGTYQKQAGMPVEHQIESAVETSTAEDQTRPTQAYSPEPISDAEAFNSIEENYDQTATSAPAVEMRTSDELVAATVPELQTPMRHVEEQLPFNNVQPNYKGTPVSQILDEIGYIHDQAGDE